MTNTSKGVGGADSALSLRERLGWPTGQFTVHDPAPEDDHGAIYLVCPTWGLMLNTSSDPTPGLDAARTQWMADVLNAALQPYPSQQAGTEAWVALKPGSDDIDFLIHVGPGPKAEDFAHAETKVERVFILRGPQAVTEGPVTLDFSPSGGGSRVTINLAHVVSLCSRDCHPDEKRVTMVSGQSWRLHSQDAASVRQALAALSPKTGEG